MKRYGILVFSIVALFATTMVALGQRNPRATTKIALSGQAVSIDYGRPSLGNRTITEELGKLPAGQFWRLGADSSTTFTTGVSLKFGDVTVPAGIYSLWAQRTGEQSWKLVFNTAHGMWGTQHPKYTSTDKYFVPLEETKASSPEDRVTITLTRQSESEGAIDIVWGDLELSAHFTT